MATEVLKIIVNDADLSRVIGKVDRARGGTRNLTGNVNQIRRDARAAGINLDDLPTLNRDARLLANTLNIPGFRQTSAALFQARRGVRAAQLSREAQALAGIDPALSRQLGIGALLGQAALVAFITTAVFTAIQKFKAEQLQKNTELEDEFREGLQLTFQEFQALTTEQTGFATFFDQIKAEVSQEGLLETVRKTTIEFLQGLGFVGDGKDYTTVDSEVFQK